jgi:hypothetical protein
MQEQLARGRDLAQRLGISILSNDACVVGDTRILGTTLWTDFGCRPQSMSLKTAMALSQKGWADDGDARTGRDYHNDFREIRYGGGNNRHRFTPSQWLQLHRESIAWLRAHLAEDWDGPTIVASHMAPSPQSLMPGSHPHDWLYATADVDDEMFSRVDCWFHGHIHEARDYEIAGCRVLANPRGYPQKPRGFDNPQWDPAMVVEVERRCSPTFGM